MTIAPLGDPRAPKAPEAPARQAAKQLEAFFLRQFLTEARPKGGMMDGDTTDDE